MSVSHGKRSTEYKNYLTARDRVIVSFDTDRGLITSFSIQYELLHNGRWRKVVRYDTHYGCHKHTFRRDGGDYRKDTLFNSFNEAFTILLDEVKYNFEAMRENYLSN